MLKDNLKKLRETNGLTKKKVAEGVGISDRAYIAYEYGERDVSTETLSKLADFYGVTTDYLLGREPLPDPFADLDLRDEDEKEVMAKYMSLPPQMRAILLDALRQLGGVMIDANGEEQPALTREEYCGTLEDQINSDDEAQKDVG